MSLFCMVTRFARLTLNAFRRYFLVVIAALVLMLIVMMFIHTNPLSSFNRAKNGMTRAQIHESFGPPSNTDEWLIHDMGPGPLPTPVESALPVFPELLFSTWENRIGPHGTLVITYGLNGKVNGKAFIYPQEKDTFILRKFLTWLGLGK